MSTDKPLLLVVEDDLGIQKQLKWSLDEFELVFAQDRASAIKQLRRYEPKVVTLDLGLPPDSANATEGLATLSEILTLSPLTKVIVVTGSDDKAHAIEAVRLGAYDFYHKPIAADTLNIILHRAYWLYELEEANQQFSQINVRLARIIGDSPEIQKLCRVVEKIAPTELTTLILGESGTGKEVFARAIHECSLRHDAPFVAINCASIPDNLLESELFGYERGAFTGAHKKTPGKIECAQGGTLFLDEIGDMPLALQAKMLRFLQERVIEPVGSRQEIEVDVRVVCATNKDVLAMAQQQLFREDLYYRVSEMTLTLPPLRERGGDVLLLARAFLVNINKELGCHVKGFDDKALQALYHYHWPGNIRELQNKIKSAVIMAETSRISDSDLLLCQPREAAITLFNLREVREEAESHAIVEALSYSGHNISKTAELLGVTRPTLYALMEKYALSSNKDNSDVSAATSSS
ncbi:MULTISPECIES: PEP-CTERM-box response regulator transcription factor [unclassified Motilimonas]|uniref:PEP-CTERM-box response regulator transcription factor n=1 Tax=unclassified Motilimonas TaxID=2643697 RepID=UPI001E549FAC|nr:MULTISPECIES: PEP-CTERM-box response regulator transcription factor [unclassified Motilimonas]MCE0556626.1 PEP-CTERM-box response regulator transcription factor [Motilimonas sp. E26]MDO6524807.1 PEP-CTERM-box response regulator transcription factor [Motilimonas sp. 1_MG-2023]